MAKKNVTIVLDEDVIRRVRELPQVREASLSTYVAELIEKEVKSQSGKEAAEKFRKLAEEIRRLPQTPWKWNREEIYAERLDRFES